ncbi:hypothetical protein M9434_007214 [Picochlorum sp. BPE23]|nr:hypothetical protein M9434_007214 [Picochlorum sp. BPE23]
MLKTRKLLAIGLILAITLHALPVNLSFIHDGVAKEDEKVKRIFIVGCGHSGTSLLASIVAKFPEVACPVPGESYLFMKTVDEAKKIMQAWDEEALQGGFKAWVEKTPIHVYNASLILSFERTYLLYIHRDPLDTAISISMRLSEEASEKACRAGLDRWTSDNHAMLSLLQHPRVLSIKYAMLSNEGEVLPALYSIVRHVGLRHGDGSRLLLSLLPSNLSEWREGNTQAHCKEYASSNQKDEEVINSFFKMLSKENSEKPAPSRLNHVAFRQHQLSQGWRTTSMYHKNLTHFQYYFSNIDTYEAGRALGYNYPSVLFVPRRFSQIPILDQANTGLAHINGPTVIKADMWMDFNVRYIMYFAGHSGKEIRIAGSNSTFGPWEMLGPVALKGFHTSYAHIATPDIYVDKSSEMIRMYFHAAGRHGQYTYVATSTNGKVFSMHSMNAIAPFYLRVFIMRGHFYGVAKNGNSSSMILQSRDGLTQFIPGPHILPRSRHTSVLVRDGKVYIFYTIVGEAPERIYYTEVMNPWDDWRAWHVGIGVPILEPELPFEGVNMPLVPSKFGAAPGTVRQLRDPYVFVDDSKLYLYYVAGGEKAISVATLEVSTALNPRNSSSFRD